VVTEVRWLAEHVEDGVLNGRIGRAGNDLVAEWSGVATLHVARDGTNVRFVAMLGADPADVEKIRRGSARVLLRHLAGDLALHGAAIEIDGRAIVLVGAAGGGKSTLAARLCMSEHATLLADDALAVGRDTCGLSVMPFESEHWLDGASRAALGLDGVASPAKQPVRANASARPSASLAAIVRLAFADADAPALRRLAGVDAVAALLPQVLRLVVDEPALQRVELEMLGAITDAVPFFELARPRDLSLLGAAAQTIAELAVSGAKP
jgi:hypothetical protein